MEFAAEDEDTSINMRVPLGREDAERIHLVLDKALLNDALWDSEENPS